MKPTLILLLFLAPMVLRAQIINGDFEKWTVPDHPDGWDVENVDFLYGPQSSGHNSNNSVRMDLDPRSSRGALRVLLSNSVYPHRGHRVTPFSRSINFWYSSFGDTNVAPCFAYTIIRKDSTIATIGYTDLGYSGGWSKVIINFPKDYLTDPIFNDTITIHFGLRKIHDANFYMPDFSVDDVSLDTIFNTSVSNFHVSKYPLSISPNPISTHANLRYTLSGTAAIHASLYDVTGREVLQLPFLEDASGSGSIPFDVDELPNGMYYLLCNILGKVELLKVIVQQ